MFLEATINAPKEKVWAVIAETPYAKSLGKHFNQEEFFESEWMENSRAKLSFEGPQEKSNGSIMMLFGNIYLQIDYAFSGQKYVEKILLMNDEDKTQSKVQLVHGPYADNIAEQQSNWETWLAEIKTSSEEI